MKTLCRTILLLVAAVLNLTARAAVEPKIFWGQPANDWSLGISTTNVVFPEGVPPTILLHVNNGGAQRPIIPVDKYSQRFNVDWFWNTGETIEDTYPPFVSFINVSSGSSAYISPKIIGFREPWSQVVECENILAGLPPGRGTLTVFISMGTGADGNELFLYSGELQLQIRARTETDPPSLPLVKWEEDGYIGNRRKMKRMISRSRIPEERWTNIQKNISANLHTPQIPATQNSSGTPSITQKSGTAASPVIATVSTGESPGSIFTPRNIIGATVVLGLLAIIASVLVRARSRQNPPP